MKYERGNGENMARYVLSFSGWLLAVLFSCKGSETYGRADVGWHNYCTSDNSEVWHFFFKLVASVFNK